MGQGRLISVMTLGTDGERIRDVFVVLTADKLRAVNIPA